MNIFLRELKANSRSLLIWSFIMIAFIFVGLTKFAAYADNPEMLAILDSLPPAMLSAFQFNTFNLTTVSGFYGVMYVYFALLSTISAAMWGSDIVSKEERDKTVEFTLVLPITRQKLITAKTLAALVNCVAFLLITWGASVVMVAKYKPDAEFYAYLRLLMVALFFMQMIFLAVGIFLGSAMKQYKRASSVAVSLLLVTYFLSVISDLNENLKSLKYLSPFKYFDVARLLNESSFDVAYIWLSLAIVAVLLTGAYFTYARRDLYI